MIDSPALADHRPGRERPGGPDGDPLRAPRRRRAARRRAERGDAELPATRRRSDSPRERAASARSPRWTGARPGDAGELLISAAPACSTRAPGSTPSTTSSSATARSPSWPSPARRRADGAEVVDARGPARLPAFFDPHVHLRTPGREDEEDLETGTRAAAAGGYCGDPRDGQHRARRSTPPPTSARCASAPRARPRSRSASSPPSPAAWRGEELTEMAELARRRRRRLLRRRAADRAAPGCCAARSSTSASPAAADRPARGGPRALRRRRHARGRGLGGARHRPGSPSISESTMIARDAALAALRGRADPRPAPLGARARSRRSRAAKAAGVADHLRGDPAPPDAHRRGGPQPRRPLQDEPAAAHRGRPPGADRGPARRRRSTASPPTTRPHAADEKEVPVRAGGDGRDRARDRVRGPPHRARPARRARRSTLLVERMTARRRALRLRAARASRPAREANLALVDPEAEWEAGGRGLGEPLGELLLRRAAR